MISQTLGRLMRVDLRQVFTTEAGDFTPWLAKRENLALLADAIGLELEYEAQEKEVGPYRADILCRDVTTDNWVLIENQLEKTDHNHLGQLLTYAAGLEAVTVVWIAERFTDEHQATLSWLNEHTDEQINFFGLEIELWCIGDSPIAPKFNIISQPNSWGRTVKAAASQSGQLSELRQIQLRFWTAFKEYMEKNSHVRCQKPAPQQWMTHPIGRSGIWLTSIVSTSNSGNTADTPEMRVQVNFGGERFRENFEAVAASRKDIDKATAFQLIWHNPPEKRQWKIYVRTDADFLNSTLWPDQHRWLKESLEMFKKVFTPYVRNLGSPETEQALSAEAGA